MAINQEENNGNISIYSDSFYKARINFYMFMVLYHSCINYRVGKKMIFVNKTFQKYSNAKAYYHKWVNHDCEIDILLIRDNENHDYRVIDRATFNHLVYEYDLDCEVLYN